MYSISKTKEGEVPQWVDFLNAGEYKKFMELLDNYFKSKKIGYTLGDGDISTEAGRMGLQNLAQKCRAGKADQWDNIVAEHFDGLKRSAVQQRDFSTRLHDFSFAKDFLGVRLYDVDYIANLDSSLVIGKPFADGIFATLVFDLPEAVMNVLPEQTIQWNKSNEEFFATGIENIKAKYPPEIRKLSDGGFDLWFISAQHHFTTNIAFHLDEYPELIGAKGALVGIPHRHSVFVYPMNDLEVLAALNTLLPTVYGINKEGPGSISANLYWYSNKEFINLPYAVKDGQLDFTPPESFVEMLDSLAPSE